MNDIAWADVNDLGVVGGWGNSTSNDSLAYIGNGIVGVDANAFELNDSGELVGISTEFGAVFTTSGTSTNPGSGSEFYGINSNGTVAGILGNRAVVGTTASLATLPATNFLTMRATGINSAGNICGFGIDVNNASRVFYFNGASTAFVPFVSGQKGASTSIGHCINDSDEIVGEGVLTLGGSVGFIFDPVNGTQLLNNLVPAGWNITNALYINNSGTILAQGTNGSYNGYVLLEPVQIAPEPSTLLLAVGALALFAALRRRRKFQFKRAAIGVRGALTRLAIPALLLIGAAASGQASLLTVDLGPFEAYRQSSSAAPTTASTSYIEEVIAARRTSRRVLAAVKKHD
jgi:hypothetical protein